MYMLNFVDFVKNFGCPDWLNYVFYPLGCFCTLFLVSLFLLFIVEKIYDVMCLINKVEDLEKEVKKLKKGCKK